MQSIESMNSDDQDYHAQLRDIYKYPTFQGLSEMEGNHRTYRDPAELHGDSHSQRMQV